MTDREKSAYLLGIVYGSRHRRDDLEKAAEVACGVLGIPDALILGQVQAEIEAAFIAAGIVPNTAKLPEDRN